MNACCAVAPYLNIIVQPSLKMYLQLYLNLCAIVNCKLHVLSFGSYCSNEIQNVSKTKARYKSVKNGVYLYNNDRKFLKYFFTYIGPAVPSCKNHTLGVDDDDALGRRLPC